MFNLFKKKYKRSDWLEGLLWAEDCVQSGIKFQYLDEPIFWDKDSMFYISKISPTSELVKGIFDYKKYYENNLKEIENNACQKGQ